LKMLRAAVTSRRTLVTLLRHPTLGSEVFVVGTSHVSKKSREEVRSTIERVRPAKVVVELCAERARGMSTQQQRRNPGSLLDMLLTQLGFSAARGSAVRDYAMRALGLVAAQGNDMVEAMRAAEATGADVVLGDVELSETWRRARSALSLASLPQLLSEARDLNHTAAGAILSEAIGHLRGGNDLDEAVEKATAVMERDLTTDRHVPRAFERLAPELYDVIVHSRDQHLADSLLTAAKHSSGRPVVAVVGLAHLHGLTNRFLSSSSSPPHQLPGDSSSRRFLHQQ